MTKTIQDCTVDKTMYAAKIFYFEEIANSTFIPWNNLRTQVFLDYESQNRSIYESIPKLSFLMYWHISLRMLSKSFVRFKQKLNDWKMKKSDLINVKKWTDFECWVSFSDGETDKHSKCSFLCYMNCVIYDYIETANELFKNAQSSQCCQLCIPIYLLFPFMILWC